MSMAENVMNVGSCGYQVYPLVGTIMERSTTPLWKWFKAIDMFSNSKNGVSACELQRTIEVTYKCAWRMANLIRSMMNSGDPNKLQGVIEVDETYVGGKESQRIEKVPAWRTRPAYLVSFNVTER